MNDSPGPDVRPKGGRLPPAPPQRSSSRNYGREIMDLRTSYGPAPGVCRIPTELTLSDPHVFQAYLPQEPQVFNYFVYQSCGIYGN